MDDDKRQTRPYVLPGYQATRHICTIHTFSTEKRYRFESSKKPIERKKSERKKTMRKMYVGCSNGTQTHPYTIGRTNKTHSNNSFSAVQTKTNITFREMVFDSIWYAFVFKRYHNILRIAIFHLIVAKNIDYTATHTTSGWCISKYSAESDVRAARILVFLS